MIKRDKNQEENSSIEKRGEKHISTKTENRFYLNGLSNKKKRTKNIPVERLFCVVAIGGSFEVLEGLYPLGLHARGARV